MLKEKQNEAQTRCRKGHSFQKIEKQRVVRKGAAGILSQTSILETKGAVPSTGPPREHSRGGKKKLTKQGAKKITHYLQEKTFKSLR